MNPTDLQRGSFARRHVLNTLAFLAVFCAALIAHDDYSWRNIQFGGFASQGYLINTGNDDYLGNTHTGTFNLREYAVNASWSLGKWRVGAQAFGQKVGPYSIAAKLDWAIVDYQPKQWFGMRAGRVKMPRGLYNEALDLDSVRPYVLLPQGVYDPRLRDFQAAFDGAMAYGNVEVRRLGSFDYKIFYGGINVAQDAGANNWLNDSTSSPLGPTKMDAVLGATLFWNTRIDGLKIGYSYSEFDKLSSTRLVNPLTARPTSQPSVRTTGTYPRHLASVEYLRGNWTFAAELGRETVLFTRNSIPTAANPIPGTVNRTNDAEQFYYYIAASRRMTRWLELGAYYDYYREKTFTRTPTFSSTTGLENARLISRKTQPDYALSARIDINDHLIFKLEGHYFTAAGKIWNTFAKPVQTSALDEYWLMGAAKITYSF